MEEGERERGRDIQMGTRCWITILFVRISFGRISASEK